MADPVWVTDENVYFDGTTEKAIVIKTVGTDRHLILWNQLTPQDQQRWIDLVDAYGGALPIPASAGSQVLNFGGSVVGGNPTGLTADNTKGYQVADFGGTVTGGGATGLDPTIDASGYQVVNVGGAVGGGDATGLLNDATVYTASVVIDGGAPQPISVTGSAAQTYTALVTVIDGQLTGASCVLFGGNIVITSNTTGVSSTVAITDTDLFSSLTAFVSIDTAVPGTAATIYTATITVDGAPQAISIPGYAAQTFTALVGQITSDLAAGTVGDAVIDAGNIKVTSNLSTGPSSTVSISGGTLFPALTGFIGFLTAVPGSGGSGQLTMTVTVDGTPILVTIDGDTALTFTALVSQIDGDLGAAATAAIDGGDIKITSATTGITSTVRTVDGTLLSQLNGFVGIDTALPGVGGLEDAMHLNKADNGQPMYWMFVPMIMIVGNKPVVGRSTDQDHIYYNGTAWVKLSDDTPV